MTGTYARTRARELEWTKAGRDGTPHAIDVYTNFLNGVAREPCGPTYDDGGVHASCIMHSIHLRELQSRHANKSTYSLSRFLARRSVVVRSSNYGIA